MIKLFVTLPCTLVCGSLDLKILPLSLQIQGIFEKQRTLRAAHLKQVLCVSWTGELKYFEKQTSRDDT